MFLKKRRKKVLLVATDIYRPAAIDQLVKLGKKVDVPVFELGNQVSPVEIARQGVAKAKAEGYDVVIVDTAGRLQVGVASQPKLSQLGVRLGGPSTVEL